MARIRYASAYSDLLMGAVADKVRRGLPLKQASDDYGISEQVITDATMAYGAHYGTINDHSKTPSELVARMRVLRSEGMTYADIARKCGVGRTTVWKYTYDVMEVGR